MSPQTIANYCVRCEMKFTRWAEYHAHVVGVPCARIIRPVNTTGRTKDQITAAWEAMQKTGALIG